MAATINDLAPNRAVPSLKGYRIHEEQVKNVVERFRELYHLRRTRPSISCSAQNEKASFGMAGNPLPMLPSGSGIWVTGTVKGPLLYSPDDNAPVWKSPVSMSRAIRCVHCGIHFPVADFLYTKKSGLCIDCWEKQVI